MPTPPNKSFAAVGWLLPGVLLLMGLPASATPASDDALRSATLGRKNPFRPLVQSATQLPTPPGLPAAVPGVIKPARIQRPPQDVTYLGIAYDGDESVAAVKVQGKVRFVRQGETVTGATLTDITPEKLVWSKNQRRLESPLHRRPGVPKP